MNNKKTKLLFATPEAAPFMTTGGLGEVAGSLTKSISEKYGDKIDIKIIMPLYQGITDYMKSQFEFVESTIVSLSWRKQYCGIFKIDLNNVTYYFIDNEYYFKRHECYGHIDDGERFAFFSKAVLHILPIIDFQPDIIHTNDWQTALIPVYLKTEYANYVFYNKIKSIITIHNIEYQGKFSIDMAEDVFDIYNDEKSIIEFDDSINLLKGALETSDVITTVSKSYSQEILDNYFSHGLSSIIEKNSSKLIGILNGIDTSIYNPETDNSLFKNYNKDSLENKIKNKTNLQGMFGLIQDENIPVIGIISRLVYHKGIDLIISSIEELIKEKVQFIVLGKGDRKYELYFKSLQEKYHDKIAIRIDYNNDVAKKIYAGSDIFLMPSVTEPCGIAQMIASRYGTVPVVRETGGLKDSIKNYDDTTGNGFTFYEQTSDALIHSVKEALKLYRNKERWNDLIKLVMSKDFSWENSAEQYYDMYLNLLR